MKFNKYFLKNQHKCWKDYYIDYKKLKIVIKESLQKKNTDNFTSILTEEIDKVNNFYKNLKKYDSKDFFYNQTLSNFIVFNYMACFKAIKKYDKICSLNYDFIKLQKQLFFQYISTIDFYRDFIKQPRVLQKIKLIIFDKDGTLILHDKIFNLWIKTFCNNIENKYNINKKIIYNILKFDSNKNKFHFDSIVPRGTNDDIRNILQNYFTSKLKIDKKKCGEIIKNCWCDINLTKDNIIPCGDLEKIFNLLHSKDIKIAICTSDDKTPTLKCLKILNIEYHIDIINCGDDLTSNKPSPEPIWEICSKLSIKPENTVMIGDTISDIHAGINARCGRVIGVLTGGYLNTELQDADMVFHSVDEVYKILE